MPKRSPLDAEQLQSLEETLGVPAHGEGNVVVACPFHDDTEPSASYNTELRLLNCFTCGRGWNEWQLQDELVLEGGADVTDSGTAEPAGEAVGDDVGLAYLVSRGLDPGILDWHVDNGYLWLSPDMRVGRNLLDDDRPRYLNEKGNKGLFWIGEAPEPGAAVWLVEGVLDGVVLKGLLPHYAVAASLGSSVSDPQAYELRGRTVFIAFDGDHAGWKGARKTQEALKEYNANGIVLDFPAELGKDLNDVWLSNPGAITEWVQKQLTVYSRSDDVFINRMFVEDNVPLLTIPTGLASWDRLLKGGLRPGLHILGGESGVGKSSLKNDVLKRAALAGRRVLVCSYELPKTQEWARLAAEFEGRDWSEIEDDPRSVSADTVRMLKGLSKNVRIVTGWTIPQIKYAAPNYDLIVCDYIQRMPGPRGGDEAKGNVDFVIEELSNLSRDLGKVVIGVSSLNRAAYGKEANKKDLKESGNIEFVAQSITIMKRPAGGDIVMANVVKNTRGREGVFYLKADLGRQTFADSDALDKAILKPEIATKVSAAERRLTA